MSDQEAINDKLVMICGGSGTGKSASLRTLKDPEGVWYCGCEAGKKLPFRSKFQETIITDPYQVEQVFDEAENIPEVHTIAIDTVTFLMEMFESVHVLSSPNTMAAWGFYQQYFKNLMQQRVASSTKNVIFTAHTDTVLDETTGTWRTCVPVKGALKKIGIEAYFSTIVSAKIVSLKDLDKYQNDLLEITPDEEALGFKHVFQTRHTKKTLGEKGMRGPMDLWTTKETFIDNDCQKLMDRLNQYYN